ncbi:MAG TPA: hypothetical protein VFU36_15290 [Jatrophihabitans sp.]|nr:hypothetical protein [Jatrophihabitans sp.]
MPYGRDFDAPRAAETRPDVLPTAELDFVGPLRPAEQAWVERTLHADSSAVEYEPADNVIRRREAHIGSLYRTATLLTLSGDLTGGHAAGFRAVAESRALAEFLAADPAYCLDCFLLGDRCPQHPATGRTTGRSEAGPSAPGSAGSSGSASAGTSGSGSGRTDAAGPGGGRGARPAPGHQPEWRRFGADEFPSASG